MGKISGLPNITRIQFSNFINFFDMRQNYFFEYVPNAYLNLCVDKAQQMEDGFYEAVARSKRCFPQGVKINKTNNNYNKVA